MKKKILSAFGMLGLGIVLLSVAHKDESGDEPSMKRIEVIRSVNGEVTTYDTLVPANSTFTAQHYLELLGFAADENIRIINAPSHHAHPAMMHHHPSMLPGFDSMFVMEFRGCAGMDSLLFKELHGAHPVFVMDSVQLLEMTISGDSLEWFADDMPAQLVIEKNVLIKQIDSLNQELLELDHMMEVLVLDSLPPAGFVMHSNDSNVVMMHTIVMNDAHANMPGHAPQGLPHGEPSFERHVENGNQTADLKVFSAGENFTLVIVSDGSGSAVKAPEIIQPESTPENLLKVYPNPADKEVSVQLNFEEKAQTKITVSDVHGKIVLHLDLGNFSGSYNQVIDVSKWSKGVYFVNVDRPGVKLVEKLVVE